MKLSFLNHAEPWLTAMIQAKQPDDVIRQSKNAIAEGCTAFGLQVEDLAEQYRTKEQLQRMFAAMGYRPVYLTNYRSGKNEGKSDAEIAEELLSFTDWGATLIDVIGDLYAPNDKQLAREPEAVAKQKALIRDIHDRGGEVLMSSHTFRFETAETVLDMALRQQESGADIVKIVTAGNSPDEEFENLRITRLLAEQLDVPFLFLSGGTHCKIHRMLGGVFGCCMTLCVERQEGVSTVYQPLIRAVKAVYDHFDYLPDRAFD